MKRHISAVQPLAAPAATVERLLLERSTELLQLAAAAPDERPAADGSFAAALEGPVGWLDPAKRVRISTGVAHRPGSTTLLPVRWHAEPLGGLFPKFDGAFEVRAGSTAPDGCALAITGGYDVPFGGLGWAADWVVLRRIAKATAEHLVAGLARELRRALSLDALPDPSRSPAPPLGSLLVRDVMTPEPAVLFEDTPVRDAAQLLLTEAISGAPVVAHDGALLGVLSEHDLLEVEAAARLPDRNVQAKAVTALPRTAGEACTRPAQVIVPDAALSDAARTMLDSGVKRLVVVDGGAVAGIITRHDVLAALVRSDREIQAAVDELIGDEGHTQVSCSVRSGSVELRGATETRSDAARLVASVTAMDGVFSVDPSELVWLRDDTRPPLPAAEQVISPR